MWKLINTGASPGEFNMSYDLQLVQDLAATDAEGLVRVYGWDPPCISLGYHQEIIDIDLEKCRNENIDLVRRPTGGRAVLHWDEVTYTVVSRVNGESLSEIYCSIGLALVNGLRRFHPEIALARVELSGYPSASPKSNIPCYSSIARYEIQHRGKKLVGSAQRRYSVQTDPGTNTEVVLQHGSVLLGPSHKRIVDLLAIESEEARELMRVKLEEKSVELSTIIGRKVDFDEAVDCLKEGFEDQWGVRFEVIGSSKNAVLSPLSSAAV